MRLNSTVTAFIGLVLPPCKPKIWLLRFLGWEIGAGCQIGFSWVKVKRLRLQEGARIGHGNFIVADALMLARSAYIGHLNRITGPLWLILSEHAGVGNQNKILRGRRGVTWGRAMLKLGIWSKITVGHIVDCTRNVSIGNYSILAGRNSQLWTHGYLHAPEGLDRFRIDGAIKIGNNVYVGSACVINAGIRIADAITIGAASCVARSLDKPGMYVSQPLRYIDLDYRQAMYRHPEVRVADLLERVVNKHPSAKS